MPHAIHGEGRTGPARRRSRQQDPRPKTVRFALTEDEYAEVSAAAGEAGLARGAFAAEAALTVARGRVTAADAPLRDAAHALDRAALLVRRIGINLNQAVARLNATGQQAGDLLACAAESMRRTERLEAAGEELRRRSLSAIRPRRTPPHRTGPRTGPRDPVRSSTTGERGSG
jgi:hypothetical protein